MYGAIMFSMKLCESFVNEEKKNELAGCGEKYKEIKNANKMDRSLKFLPHYTYMCCFVCLFL
jgi:hypothetical protein